MKKRIKYLVIIIFTMSVYGCIGPIGTMPDFTCNLGAHLGIGENCGGINCTFKNYNTSTGADAFLVPIYRVGSENSFSNAPATPDSTTTGILSAYAGLATSEKNSIKNGIPAQDIKLTEVRIFNISGKLYIWDKSIFGVNAGTNPSGLLALIASGALPVAQ